MVADMTSAGSVSANLRRLRGIGDRTVKLFAATALVLFGLFLMLSWWSEPQSPIVLEGGALVAGGQLEAVLYDPSLGGRETGPSVVDSYMDKAGRSCRRFTDGPVDGVACQIQGDWRVVEMRQR